MEVKLLLWVDLLPQAELCSDLFPVFLLGWPWLDLTLLEIISQLERYLLQCFFRKLEVVASEFSERHELNDVSAHIPFVLIRIQRRHICIQLVHSREVGIAYANNDDTQRII